MAGDYDGRLINGYLSLPFLLERSSERRRKIAQTENRKKNRMLPALELARNGVCHLKRGHSLWLKRVGHFNFLFYLLF